MTRLQDPESDQEKRPTDMIHLYEKDILHLCYIPVFLKHLEKYRIIVANC